MLALALATILVATNPSDWKLQEQDFASEESSEMELGFDEEFGDFLEGDDVSLFDEDLLIDETAALETEE